MHARPPADAYPPAPFDAAAAAAVLGTPPPPPQVSEPTCMDYDRRTPLHVAAAEGAFSVAQWLLEEGADKNALDRHQRTPLEEAARSDHMEVRVCLPCVRAGVVLIYCSDRCSIVCSACFQTAFDEGFFVCRVHCAACSQRLQVARLLMEQRACILEDDKLVPLEQSKMRGLVNTRRAVLADIGLDAEWEISPKELKLVEKIGSGEFGDVYKAVWHGSYVAAKLLRRSDEIALGDFRTEIAILRKVHHPNCTQFLGTHTARARTHGRSARTSTQQRLRVGGNCACLLASLLTVRCLLPFV